MKNQFLLKSIFALAISSFTFSASANLITTLTGQNGIINVEEEVYNHPFEGSGLHYAVDILDESSDIGITAFAVSNNLGAFGGMHSTRTGWLGIQISHTQWDSGFVINSFHNDILTTDLGLFSQFFGEDYFANIFMMPAANEDNSIVANDDEQTQFTMVNMIGFSDFVALNNGDIVDHSRDFSEDNHGETSVPEPSTLAIFALGMMGLASRRFKK